MHAALERRKGEAAAREKCPAGEVGEKLAEMSVAGAGAGGAGRTPAEAAPGEEDEDDIDCF